MPTRTTPTIKNKCSVRRIDSHVPGTREGTPPYTETYNDKRFFYYCAKYPYAPLPPQRRRETDPGAGGGEAGCPGPCRPRSLRCVSRILIRKTLCLLYKSFRTHTKSIPGPCRVSPQWASACSTVSQRYLYVS